MTRMNTVQDGIIAFYVNFIVGVFFKPGLQSSQQLAIAAPAMALIAAAIALQIVNYFLNTPIN